MGLYSKSDRESKADLCTYNIDQAIVNEHLSPSSTVRRESITENSSQVEGNEIIRRVSRYIYQSLNRILRGWGNKLLNKKDPTKIDMKLHFLLKTNKISELVLYLEPYQRCFLSIHVKYVLLWLIPDFTNVKYKYSH